MITNVDTSAFTTNCISRNMPRQAVKYRHNYSIDLHNTPPTRIYRAALSLLSQYSQCTTPRTITLSTTPSSIPTLQTRGRVDGRCGRVKCWGLGREGSAHAGHQLVQGGGRWGRKLATDGDDFLPVHAAASQVGHVGEGGELLDTLEDWGVGHDFFEGIHVGHAREGLAVHLGRSWVGGEDGYRVEKRKGKVGEKVGG